VWWLLYLIGYIYVVYRVGDKNIFMYLTNHNICDTLLDIGGRYMNYIIKGTVVTV
jgi:hypothetical protein